jgi:hypothetical protein
MAPKKTTKSPGQCLGEFCNCLTRCAQIKDAAARAKCMETCKASFGKCFPPIVLNANELVAIANALEPLRKFAAVYARKKPASARTRKR